MERIGKKGFVFSTEAMIGIGLLMLVLSSIVLLAEHKQTGDNKEWRQLQAVLNTQTNELAKSPQSNYFGKSDYYCYQLYWLEIRENPLPLQEQKNCEEIP